MSANLSTLFGSQSFCECAHCRSVYSPAAYLVDLLHELDDLQKKSDGTLKHGTPADAPTPIGVLSKRRPDIAAIPLTCENTNTPLPYIDLVNEALESYIESQLAPSSAPTIKAHDTGKATADELRAVPQHVVPEVYEHLGLQAVYPMTLPFHRPLAVARTYLGHLGTSRADIIEVFGADSATSRTALVVERLGMSPSQYQIMTGIPSTDLSSVFDSTEVDGVKEVWEYYGYSSPSGLSNLVKVPGGVPELLHRTGIAFDELVALLQTRFLNPALFETPQTNVVTIEFPSSLQEDACDVSKMKLTNLDPAGSETFAHDWLGRLHRFVRLWRTLGWNVADVDRALAAVGGALDAAALERLAALKAVLDTLGQPVGALVALWAPLDTWGEDSSYAQVFLNRAVVQDAATRKVFEVAQDPSPPTTNETLATHLPVIAAALAVTSEDVERVRAHAGLDQDAPLNLGLLSTLYRYTALAKAVGLRVRDLITLLRLVPASMHPFTPGNPLPSLEFVRTVRSVQASGFPIPLLNYLFRNEAEATRHPAPTRALVKTTLETLQGGMAAIHQEMLVSEQPPADILRARLEVAAGPQLLELTVPEDVERALAVLDPRVDTFQGQQLTLQDREKFVDDHFKRFLADPAKTLFSPPFPTSTDLDAEKRFLENVGTVLEALLPWLRRHLHEAVVVETMAAAMGVEQAAMRHLLEKLLASTDPQLPGSALEQLLGLVGADGAPLDLHLDDDPPRPPTLLAHRVFKAAAYVNGFGMTDAELALFTGPSSPLPTFDPNAASDLYLNALPIDGVVAASSTLPGTLFELWRVLRAYYEVRDALPRSEKTLVDFFEAKDTDTLVEATGWNKDHVADVVKHLGLQNPPLASLDLVRLQRAMVLLKRVGATPERVFAWSGTTPNHGQADEIVQTVKARYERARWLEVARGLNDALRERQRDALVAFLTPRLAGAPFPIETANDLFQYFLLDVEMSSCMLTSRIKQAISSVQLFVQRCLLNLEPAVSPAEIGPERWEWMKHYRIWEANRKVFLYPETYILPELRDDKTPFFKELETELLQNELTEETIEKAFVNYLYKLDEVARLDIRGFCKQEEGGQEIYHVFGRTWNLPYTYYYRRGTFTKNAGEGEWTPWERVDVDIQGDHLLTFVYGRRLYLLWPIFEEKPDKNQAGAEITTHWNIRVAWTERGLTYHTKWAPKQVSSSLSNEVKASFALPDKGSQSNSRLVLRPDAESVRIELFSRKTGIGKNENKALNLTGQGAFVVSECKGHIVESAQPKDAELRVPGGATHDYQALDVSWGPGGGLHTGKYILLKSPALLRLTPPADKLNLRDDLYSFFMQDKTVLAPAKIDARQSYFARPVSVTASALNPLAAAPGTAPDLKKELHILEFVLAKDLLGPDPTQVLSDVVLPAHTSPGFGIGAPGAGTGHVRSGGGPGDVLR